MHDRSLRRLPALVVLLVSLLAACTGHEGLPAPTIETVTPTALPSSGGTLTVTGTNFYRVDDGAPIRVEACGVTLNATLTDGEPNDVTLPPGSTVRTIWGETLTVNMPSGATPGTSTVIVTRPDGQRAVLEGALECQSPTVPDTEEPTVTLNAPDTANLGDTLTLTGTASDDIGVTDLTLRTGDTIVASFDPTSDQATITLDGTTWTTSWTPDRAGEHELTITARDASGKQATATATVILAHDYAIVTNTNDAGYGSLRSSIAHAQFDTPITFDPTVFDEPKTILLDTPLQITVPATIEGPGEELLTLDGNSENRVIENPDGHNLRIANLTIQNGHAPGADGGAILTGAADHALALQYVTLRNNQAHNGGAIHSAATTTILDNVTLTENTASGDGGGIHAGGETLILLSARVTTNTADGDGGGVHATAAQDVVLLGNTEIAGNTADGSGGGVHGESRAIVLEYATVDNNRAGQDGGGLHLTATSAPDDEGAIVLNQSTISNNAADRNGGGLLVTGATNFVANETTIISNEAGNEGGGAHIRGVDTIIVANTPITFNTAGTVGGGLYLQTPETQVFADSPITDNTPDDTFNE